MYFYLLNLKKGRKYKWNKLIMILLKLLEQLHFCVNLFPFILAFTMRYNFLQPDYIVAAFSLQ